VITLVQGEKSDRHKRCFGVHSRKRVVHINPLYYKILFSDRFNRSTLGYDNIKSRRIKNDN